MAGAMTMADDRPLGQACSPPTRGAKDRAPILVVDDRPDKLLALSVILESLEQEIVTASSGEEALKLLLARDFAVVLLDVNMPGLDGLETAALIRRRRKSEHLPIIFITADYHDERHMAQGYALGAVDYIASPVVPEVLCAKVKVFVELFLLARQAQRQAQQDIALAEERAARQAAERASRRLAFLAQASAVLAGSLDAGTTARELGRLVVPALADASLLVHLREDGAIAQVEIPDASGSDAGDAPEPMLDAWLGERVFQARDTLMPQQIDAGTAALPSQAVFPGGTPVHSIIAVPLAAGGRTLAVLVLGRSRRTFDADSVAVARDLASRAATALDNARLYREIQTADHRKNEFLAMLAHELRNPLAPIANAVHVLNAYEGDTDKLAWSREVIGRQLKQLTRLVDDLLDLSRITRGKIELHEETVDVRDVAAAAVETCRPLIDAQGHTLEVRVPATDLAVKGDFARLAQVLSNLLNNAAKYTERGGRITLEAEAQGTQVVFRVSDTGMGIEPSKLDSIFEPFMQIDRTLDRAQGGLGIGLTLVRRLVEMQGGQVSGRSAGRGQGSEFTIRMPMAPPRTMIVASEPRATIAEPGRPLAVLVVDDNRDVASSMALVLRTAGHAVFVSHDGPDAIETMTRVQPDAVLLDIGLPGADGFEVARRIRANPHYARTLLVAISGYGQDDHRLLSRAAGFDHHLVKPVEPDAVLHLLATVPAAAQTAAAPARPATTQ